MLFAQNDILREADLEPVVVLCVLLILGSSGIREELLAVGLGSRVGAGRERALKTFGRVDGSDALFKIITVGDMVDLDGDGPGDRLHLARAALGKHERASAFDDDIEPIELRLALGMERYSAVGSADLAVRGGDGEHSAVFGDRHLMIQARGQIAV